VQLINFLKQFQETLYRAVRKAFGEEDLPPLDAMNGQKARVTPEQWRVIKDQPDRTIESKSGAERLDYGRNTHLHPTIPMQRHGTRPMDIEAKEKHHHLGISWYQGLARRDIQAPLGHLAALRRCVLRATRNSEGVGLEWHPNRY
jgi:hypothetical protein